MAISLEHVPDPLIDRNFQTLQALVPDTGARSVGMRFGTKSISTTAAVTGTASVTHGLGKTPIGVLATANNASVGLVVATVTTMTSTTFSLEMRYTDGTARTATIVIAWMVFG